MVEDTSVTGSSFVADTTLTSVVGGDSYLLQLVRYIHRNPVKAGIVNKPDDYLWSSHKGYLSVAKKNGSGFTKNSSFRYSRKTGRSG